MASRRIFASLLFLIPFALGAQSTYNVKQYGAQGNGYTNDTGAIQAAINAAHSANSGTIYFPTSTGCYMVTSLKFYSNLRYQGQTQDVCLESINNNVSIATTASSAPFSNATISSLTFSGSGTVASGYECVSLSGPTNVIIDHVTVTKCAGDGFYVTGYGTNLANPGSGLLISNVTASYNGRNGMSIITGKNITVRNSVFQYSNKGAPYDGVDIEPNNASQTVQNVTFENCSFLNNGKSGSSASGHNGFNVWETYADLQSLNLRLVDCTFSGNLRDGLYAAGSGHILTGIYLIGGSMSNNQALNGYRGGVDIWNTNNVVVSNMNISASTSSGQAVFLYGVNGGIVANSTLSAGSKDLNTNSSTNVKLYTSTKLVQGTHSGNYTTVTGAAPTILSASVPTATRGTAYSYLLTATGDAPVTWTAVSATGNRLPPGVSLATTGFLSGIPITAGAYTFSVQATNGVTFDEKTFTLRVN